MKKIKKILILAAICAFTTVQNAFAAISDSSLFTGTTNLVNDLMSWMQVFGGVVAGAMLVYSLIRRSTADEQDQKKWKDKAILSVVTGVGVIVAGGLIKAITGYYS